MPFRTLWSRAMVAVFVACWMIAIPVEGQTKLQRRMGSDPPTHAETRGWAAVYSGDEGLSVSNSDRSSEIRIQGYLQADGRLFVTDLNGRRHDVFLFRSVRVLAEGTFANRLKFRVMPDFAEGKIRIQDVYAEWTLNPLTKLRAGKFKVPIGLEILRSARDLTFAERSLASDLAPCRDLGVELEGSFRNGAATYNVGYFSGAKDGTNANFEWRGAGQGVVRVVVKPFATAKCNTLRPLNIGIAASAGHARNAPPSFKTMGREIFFKYASGTTVGGQHRRISPQAYYFRGRFGLLAEYVVSGETMQAGIARRYLSNHGWEFSSSIFLTGETNAFAHIHPNHAFRFFKQPHHWGAWEAAIRFSQLRVDLGTFPIYADPGNSTRRATESAFGLNWHVNSLAKFMVDYEYTAFRMATRAISQRDPERAVIVRMQLAF